MVHRHCHEGAPVIERGKLPCRRSLELGFEERLYLRGQLFTRTYIQKTDPTDLFSAHQLRVLVQRLLERHGGEVRAHTYVIARNRAVFSEHSKSPWK